MLSNNNITVVKWCQPLIVLKICKMSNDLQEFKDSIFIFSTILNCIGYNMPPKHLFVNISLIIHLYKSLTSYLLKIDLSFDLFLAKYGGFVIKNLLL